MSDTSLDIREVLRGRARERRVEIMDRSLVSYTEASVMATLDVATVEIAALTRRAEAAEAERDALRKVTDEMVERAWEALAGVCGVVCYNDDGEYMPFHHINHVEREDVRAALTAAVSALAVQPTTGDGA